MTFWHIYVMVTQLSSMCWLCCKKIDCMVINRLRLAVSEVPTEDLVTDK